MSMDAKKTIEKLRGEADRQRMSLYLSQSTFKEFKELCAPLSASKVIEELMRQFIDESKNKSRKKTKKKPGKY